MAQPITLNHTLTDNNSPLLLLAGELATGTGPTYTRLWFSDGAANRLVLSDRPIDNPVFDFKNYLPISGGTISGSMTFVGSTNASAPFLFAHHYVSGTVPSGQSASWYALNIDGDNADASSAQGGGASSVYLGSNITAGASGGRNGLFAYLNQTGPTAMTLSDYYVASAGFAVANYPAGGTPGAPVGALFGANFSAQLNNGATGWLSCVGEEITVGVEAGNAVAFKSGLSIVQWASDAVQGTLDDVALQIATQPNGSAPGWKVGIEFGAYTGWWPFQASATLIGTMNGNNPGPPMQAANGIDLSGVTFFGNAYASPGFYVTGSGHIHSDDGIDFGANAVINPGDFSKHIELYTGYAGLSVTGGRLNIVSNGQLVLCTGAGATTTDVVDIVGNEMIIRGLTGFNGSAPIAKPSITGSQAGNTALASLLAALDAYGLITDTTTP